MTCIIIKKGMDAFLSLIITRVWNFSIYVFQKMIKAVTDLLQPAPLVIINCVTHETLSILD